MCYSALVKREVEYLGLKYEAVVNQMRCDRFQALSLEDPKRFPPLRDRIYPGRYAPVVMETEGKRSVEIMKYGVPPVSHAAVASGHEAYNARRDNLTSRFWEGAFLRHHGFVVLERFFEWVPVRRLLSAGVVSMDQVRQEFLRQTQEREDRCRSTGRVFKPTPTEKKDPVERQVIVEFFPEEEGDLLVPVIGSFVRLEDGFLDGGFAVVTDEPPSEVKAAGHDRCPVILDSETTSAWMASAHATSLEASELLGRKRRVVFRHKLASGS
jgi:putative SOS response-associated peptidase YedK